MERYEAILAQLEKAQSRGMETISNRLDSVVSSLDELIQEAKSTVQGALPESADEYLAVDEIKAALDAFREEADIERSRAKELETKLGDLERGSSQVRPGTTIELMRALDRADSQSELLKELLPAISDHSARAVVLVLRDGKVSAWSGIGFTDGEVLRTWQGEAAESAALVKLLEVSRPVRFAPAKDELFNSWLRGEETPQEIMLIPVVLRGKLMGTVYIDRIEGQPWSPETAQVLIAQVCWLIDTLQYRSATAPSLAEPEGIELTVEVETPDVPQTEADAAPQTEPEDPDGGIADDEVAEDVTEEVEDDDQEDEPAVVAEPVAEEPETLAAEEPEQETVDVDPSATMRIDVAETKDTESSPSEDVESVSDVEVDATHKTEISGDSFEAYAPVETYPEPEMVTEDTETEEPVAAELETPAEPEFEPAPADEEAPEEPAEEEEPVEVQPVSPESFEAPAAVQMPVEPPPPEDTGEEPEAASSGFLDEPPPVQPVQPPPDEPKQEVSEDEAQREEARRFARLLVSEIKLYNEEQVERGRESGDIYKRLREDIDRSREMFDKRIAAEVRASQDYFTDELVRILGDGDPNALGM